jgi:hypothetical protein
MLVKLFAVVLDTTRVFHKTRCTVLVDSQDLEEIVDEKIVARTRRRAELPEVARRLAMLCVEGFGNEAKRLLSAEEHRSILGVSEIEYSNRSSILQ